MGKAKQSNSSKNELEIDPRIIRFTHSRIRPFFTGCGKRVEETLDDLINHRVKIADIPPITVIPVKNQKQEVIYYSLNNRRLYVFKSLATMGLLEGNMIRVRVKEALEREKERYQEDRCSLHATIMKEHRDRPGSHTADAVDDESAKDETAEPAEVR
jgi:hypothetical protein